MAEVSDAVGATRCVEPVTRTQTVSDWGDRTMNGTVRRRLIRFVTPVVVVVAGLLAAPAGRADASVTYYFMQARHSGLCGHVVPNGYVDQNRLIQTNCYGGSHSLFALQPSDDGHWRLIVLGTSKCLDVIGNSQSDRAKIQQYSCHSGWNQQWDLRPTDSGYYQIVARHSQKCMDVQGDYTTHGAYIWQYPCDLGDNQQFRFI
jgi:hypothetical protein